MFFGITILIYVGSVAIQLYNQYSDLQCHNVAIGNQVCVWGGGGGAKYI